MYIYICIYIYTYIYRYIYIDQKIYKYIGTYIYAHTYIHMCICRQMETQQKATEQSQQDETLVLYISILSYTYVLHPIYIFLVY